MEVENPAFCFRTSFCFSPPPSWRKCQENNKCIKGQRRTNRPLRAFITFAVGYSRGVWAVVLTFGLFLHHVEPHIAVAPNNVRGKDLGAARLCLLLLCSNRNDTMAHITWLLLTSQSIHNVMILKGDRTPFLAWNYIIIEAEKCSCFCVFHLKKASHLKDTYIY